jgi:hypothetical protein
VTAEDTAMYYCASDPVRELQYEPNTNLPSGLSGPAKGS